MMFKKSLQFQRFLLNFIYKCLTYFSPGFALFGYPSSLFIIFQIVVTLERLLTSFHQHFGSGMQRQHLFYVVCPLCSSGHEGVDFIHSVERTF